MKFKFPLIWILTLLMATAISKNALAQTSPQLQNAVEQNIGYAQGLIGSKLDYDLVPGDNRKFSLKITNSKKSNLVVKIYDIIGNLILADKISQEQNGHREYDFSDITTKIFVVKVDSGDENLIKKVTI